MAWTDVGPGSDPVICQQVGTGQVQGTLLRGNWIEYVGAPNQCANQTAAA